MASTERQPIMGVWGQSPQRGRPGAESLVRRLGGKRTPEAERFLRIGHPKEGANWWSDCHECHLESFLVWYTTEDSFVIGVDVAKVGGGLERSSLTEVYAYEKTSHALPPLIDGPVFRHSSAGGWGRSRAEGARAESPKAPTGWV